MEAVHSWGEELGLGANGGDKDGGSGGVLSWVGGRGVRLGELMKGIRKKSEWGVG